MRIVLVANPGGRAVTDAAIEATFARWSARHQVTLVRSGRSSSVPPRKLVAPAQPSAQDQPDQPDQADWLGLALAGAEAVVVLGGDGILNQVANLLADARSDAALVPLPAGTTNVVARSLGLPTRLADASAAALAGLEAGQTARRAWGRLNGRGFLANAGIGFDAAVVTRTEAHHDYKQRWGHAWFAAAALLELRGTMRTAHLSLDEAPERESDPESKLDPGGPAETDFWIVALASHPYTYVGPRPMVLVPPSCRPASGLCVVRFEPMPTRRLVRVAAQATFTSRGVVGLQGVHYLPVVGALRFTSPVPLPAQTDGEPLPPARAFTLEAEPAAVRLLAPLQHVGVLGRHRVGRRARYLGSRGR